MNTPKTITHFFLSGYVRKEHSGDVLAAFYQAEADQMQVEPVSPDAGKIAVRRKAANSQSGSGTITQARRGKVTVEQAIREYIEHHKSGPITTAAIRAALAKTHPGRTIHTALHKIHASGLISSTGRGAYTYTG